MQSIFPRAVLVLLLASTVAYAQYGGGFGGGYQPPSYEPPSYEPPRFDPPSYEPPSMDFPQYEPPEMPSMDFTPPSMMEEYTYCTNCNNEVSDFAAPGQSCPHCGVRWSGYDHSSSFGDTGSSAPWSTSNGTSNGGARGSATPVIVMAALGGACMFMLALVVAGVGAIVFFVQKKPKPQSNMYAAQKF